MCARTFFVAWLGAFTPFALAGQQANTVQQPAPPAAAIELPMELLASRPLIRVKVNGQGPFAFLIDPQAAKTTIDARLVETLKLPPQKNAEGRPDRHVDLQIGPATIAGVAVDERDTSRLVPEFGAAAQPRGVLSLSIWADHLVTLDYTRWRMIIEPGALPEPNEKDIFGLGASPDEQLPALTVGERSVRCRIDPLFPGGLLLPSNDVLDLPLADTATLGAFVFKTPAVQFGGPGGIATLGWQWLADFSLTYDATHGRVQLKQPRPASR